MTEAKKTDPFAALPTAREVMTQIALREAEKASVAVRELSAADAEKQALLDKFSKPSGVSTKTGWRARPPLSGGAANNGLTEVQIMRFPHLLCTDRGRAINQGEDGWEKTLTGLPKELYDFWKKHLQERGYKLSFQVVDFPGGIPGDIGMTLKWN
jgi:hypothetical protein